MGKIKTPFEFPDLSVWPPLSNSPNITDDIQQTLATLAGYNGQQRHLLRCSDNGILTVVNPPNTGFINVGGLGAGGVYDGVPLRCSEVIVRAHPDNTDRVWLNLYAAADADDGWPLEANEYIVLSITDMQYLHLLIVAAAEKVIIAYTQ
ncbi:unnamed protein product [marine sediment metagenome]|uniref:Uncharacterized protein n=1 Tax=marine sediment metagenome TaxID=412755 RepID=X1RZK2_9ZZZZ